ncbi:hypothetical protein VSP9026_03193 [Vibrio spartinae]|uniref:Uncharacterized protein n=1 Tax=Vibrio spartinae TaxID=1918945 RepID=A0A1N6M7P0_9VIBR|nr:hypothetical protein VSP9026_03193 [Vibrio spartinae]
MRLCYPPQLQPQNMKSRLACSNDHPIQSAHQWYDKIPFRACNRPQIHWQSSHRHIKAQSVALSESGNINLMFFFMNELKIQQKIDKSIDHQSCAEKQKTHQIGFSINSRHIKTIQTVKLDKTNNPA